MPPITAQMWAAARWVRLGGMPEEACCEVELAERSTQTTGETWRVELDLEADPLGETGAFVLACICGSRAFLREGISAEVA